METQAVAHLHPLHVARADDALVPLAILVLEVSFEHHGHRGLASVRVIRETGSSDDLEVVQHKKRCKVAEVLGADTAADSRADAFLRLDGEHWRTSQLSGDLRCGSMSRHRVESLMLVWVLGWEEALRGVGGGG